MASETERSFAQIQASIDAQKARLDNLRPLHPTLLESLQKYYDIELTYTSNALEGNTLTARETAEVIEHGITVGGKPLRDHLEAQDHYDALLWMRGQASSDAALTEITVTELHRRIVLRSQPRLAGIYSPHPRRIAGSAAVFPNPVKIPALMEAFGQDLTASPLTPYAAFDAHYRLTAIHPFSDGNGRTARLLMNLMLLRGGFPPVAVGPEHRLQYLQALESASLTEDTALFQTFMHARLETTLEDYLSAFAEAIDKA